VLPKRTDGPHVDSLCSDAQNVLVLGAGDPQDVPPEIVKISNDASSASLSSMPILFTAIVLLGLSIFGFRAYKRRQTSLVRDAASSEDRNPMMQRSETDDDVL